jgi:ParB family chromosome partitioning protein
VADPSAVARRIVEKGLTVRDVERLAKDHALNARPSKSAAARPAKDADTRAIEKTLSDALGMRVELRSEGESGELRIRYESLEQLDSICRLLTQ